MKEEWVPLRLVDVVILGAIVAFFYKPGQSGCNPKITELD
jgi:hypothetical protein